MFTIERENDTIVVKKDGKKIMPQDCTPAEYALIIKIMRKHFEL